MRKKIPLIGGIINLIESLKGDIGIIENTDVATHSISAGSYVIWHNELYKASSAIAVDDALSASNLTAVSGGAVNELNNNFKTVTFAVSKQTSSKSLDAIAFSPGDVTGYRLVGGAFIMTGGNDDIMWGSPAIRMNDGNVLVRYQNIAAYTISVIGNYVALFSKL